MTWFAIHATAARATYGTERNNFNEDDFRRQRNDAVQKVDLETVLVSFLSRFIRYFLSSRIRMRVGYVSASRNVKKRQDS